MQDAFPCTSSEYLAWLELKATKCLSIELARANFEAAHTCGDPAVTARAHLVLALREFEADNPKAFLQNAQAAVDSLAADDELMQTALRYLSAAELSHKQFEKALTRFGQLNDSFRPDRSWTRRLNPMGRRQKKYLNKVIRTMLGCSGPQTAHWVGALGELALAFPKKTIQDKSLWDLFLEDLGAMLDTSQHPSSDLDTMLMGAEPEMVEAAERERELRDIQPDENPVFSFRL